MRITCPPRTSRPLERWLMLALISVLMLSRCCCDANNDDGGPKGGPSLTFVFDITGSMVNDLKQVSNGANDIITKMSDTISEYNLITFRDPDVQGPMSTTDGYAFMNLLKQVQVGDGDDCPEPSISAIIKALEVSRPDSFIYVFTDASAKDYNLTKKASILIQEKRTQVVFIMTGDCGDVNGVRYQAYEEIAAQSSGQIFRLEKNQVEQILRFVVDTIGTSRVNLYQKDFNGADVEHSTHIEIPIDPYLHSITIRVSGGSPNINVRALMKGGYSIVQNNASLQEDFREMKVDKIHTVTITNLQRRYSTATNPRMKFSIDVTAVGKYSIRISGTSPLNFDYGFSIRNNASFENTVLNPRNGHEAFMYFNLSLPFTITKMLFFDKEAKPIVLPEALHQINRTVYLSESRVKSPSFPFIVMLKGTYGDYEFQRISKTMINPSDNYKPRIKFPKVHYKQFYGELQVECTVLSLKRSNVTLLYKLSKKVLNTKMLTDSGSVTATIKDDISNRTEIVCQVTTDHETTNVTTTIFKRVKPPVIATSMNHTSTIGDSIELSCKVTSKEAFTIEWFSNGQLLNSIRETLRIQVDDSKFGIYTCRAMNSGGSSEINIHVFKRFAPMINMQHAVYEIVKGDSLVISCDVEANPKAVVSWAKQTNPVGRKIEGKDLSITNFLRSTNYTCYAENSIGSVEHTVQVILLEKPIIKHITESKIYEIHTSITLYCDAVGTPQPVISWFNEGSMLVADRNIIFVNNSRKLIIKKASAYDKGKYTCVAENYYINGNLIGSQEASTNVEVGSAPSSNDIRYNEKLFKINTLDTLLCPYTNYEEILPKLTTEWYFNNKKIINSTEIKVNLNSELVFKNIKKAHEGEYYCIVKNKFGQVKMNLFIQVFGLVKPYFIVQSKRMDPAESTSVYLQCDIPNDVYPVPSITWHKDNVLLDIRDSYRIEVEYPKELIIDSVNPRDHNAQYKCVIGNEGGESQQLIDLTVKTVPEGNVEHRVITVNRGRNVTLPCLFSGHPAVTYSWQKDDFSIDVTDNKKPNYELKKLELADKGIYRCTAMNEMGVKTKTIQLKINDVPFITTEETEYITNIGTKTSTSMYCKARGTPQPTITWFYLRGKSIQQIDASMTKYDIDDQFNLIILDSKLTDPTQYKCQAKNTIGNDTKMITHIIREEPKFSNLNFVKDISVLYGDSLRVNCRHSAHPAAKVEWFFNGQNITSNATFTFSQGMLTARPVNMTHSGTYRCIVKNAAGTIARVHRVNVGRKPYIITNSTRAFTIQRNRKKLFCEGHGTPNPEITWLKDDKKLELGDNILSDAHGVIEIQSPRSEDAGRYTCIFTNQHGEARHSIDLSIYVIPVINGDMPGAYRTLSNATYTKLDEAYEIMCEAKGFPLPNITWYRNDVRLENKDFSTRSLSLGRNGNSIIFKKITHSEVATYHCAAANDAGNSTYYFKVNVIQSPMIDTNVLRADTNIEIDDSLKLHCAIYGDPKPQIHWSFNNVSITKENRTDVAFSQDMKFLRIERATTAHQGNWSCSGANAGGGATIRFGVTVFVPVRFSSAMNEVRHVHSGNKFSVDCSAEGNPAPAMKWVKNGVRFSPNLGDGNTFSDNRQILTVAKMTMSDSGIYSCEAENHEVKRLGEFSDRSRVVVHSVQKIFNVKISVLPFIKKSEMKANVSVIVGGTVSLTCPYGGIPWPKITWTFQDATSDVLKRRALYDERGSKLTLPKVRDSYDGVYTCTVYNGGLAYVSASTRLHVLHVPKIKVEHYVNEVGNRKEMNVTCTAVGIPKPTIKWFIGNEEQHDDTNMKTKNYEFHKFKSSNPNEEIIQFRIGNMKSREFNAGLTCIASNKVGSDMFKYTITRKDKTEVESLVTTRAAISSTSATLLSSSSSRDYLLGARIEIFCVVNGYPHPKVTFRKDGQAILISDTQQRIVIDGNKRVIKLMIRNSEVFDEGLYTCEASNKYNSDSKEIFINILVPAKIKYNENKLNADIQTIVEGTKKVLICEAIGIPAPTFTWSRNGINLTETSNIYFGYGVHKGMGVRKLIIDPVTMDDKGNYACYAHNKIGNDTKNYRLVVHSMPNIKIDNLVRRLYINKGNKATFHCATNAKIINELKWFLNGSKLILKSHMTISSDMKVMTIASTTLRDEGIYTCSVSNAAGDVSINFRLTVIEPVVITTTGTRHKVNIMETVVLQCQATGVPKPEIFWDKKGKLHERADFSSRMRYENGGSRLVITDIKESDAGKYRCVAVNDGGTMTQFHELVVYVPPKINGPRYEYIFVNNGGNTLLHCNASSGVPEPSIRWTFKDRPLVSSAHIFISTDGRTIRIHKAMARSVDGLFTCKMSNHAGSDSKHILVMVLKAPEILNKGLVIEMEERSKALIQCRVRGTANMRVQWTGPNSQKILFSDRSYIITENIIGKNIKLFQLQIPIISAALGGDYTCLVMNRAGTARITHTVNLLFSPLIMTSLQRDFYPIVSDFPSLHCTIERAYPSAGIVWYKKAFVKPNQPLRGNRVDPMFWIIENGGESLKFHQAKGITNDHQGVYYCEATNRIGSDRMFFNITVYKPPKFTGNYEVKKVLENAANVTMQCPQVNAFPTPKIYWINDGVTISKGNRTHVLHRPTVANNGFYICVAENQAGLANYKFELIVYEKPKIINMPEEWTILQGETGRLVCDVRRANAQRLIYTWHKVKGSIIGNPSYRVLENELTLFNASLIDNNSQFYCTATNILSNTTSSIVTLQVYDTPRLLDGPNMVDVVMMEGNDSVFKCHVDKTLVPDPKWTWTFYNYKNEKEAEDDGYFYFGFDGNGTYKMLKIRVNELGIYTCELNTIVAGKKLQIKKRFVLAYADSPKFLNNDNSPVIKEVKSGGKVEFSCAMPPSDSTKTSIQFFKKLSDGRVKIMKKTDEVSLQMYDNGSRLVMKLVNVWKSEEYVCQLGYGYLISERSYTLRHIEIDRPQLRLYKLTQAYTYFFASTKSLVDLDCRTKPFNGTLTRSWVRIKDGVETPVETGGKFTLYKKKTNLYIEASDVPYRETYACRINFNEKHSPMLFTYSVIVR